MSFAALNKGVVANDGTFFTLLKAALNKALPDIGQAVYPAADNGRYIIDFGAVSSGPVTTYTYGIQTLTLPTLVLNYTVEFNGLFMATLDLDGKGSMAANGGAFDTRDAFTMSQMFLLANINPPLAGVSALQTNLKVSPTPYPSFTPHTHTAPIPSPGPRLQVERRHTDSAQQHHNHPWLVFSGWEPVLFSYRFPHTGTHPRANHSDAHDRAHRHRLQPCWRIRLLDELFFVRFLLPAVLPRLGARVSNGDG